MSLLELERLLEQDAREHPARRAAADPALAWLGDVTLLASRATRMPMAFVSVLDSHDTYFVAQQGSDLAPAARASTLCDLVARAGQPVVIPDASREPALQDYPAVREGLLSYVGVPVRHRLDQDDLHFSLCVAGPEPREDADEAVEVLQALARLTERTLQHAPGLGAVA